MVWKKNYKRNDNLRAICSYSEQLLFIDETSKDGLDAFRFCAHSNNGARVVVRVLFNRGHRVSVFSDLACNVFISWTRIEGTYSHNKFHNTFSEFIIPYLNPWTIPKSIVVSDNAKINMIKELEDAFHQCGARFILFPPFSPELNPI